MADIIATVLTLVFWLCFAGLLHTYIVYPKLMKWLDGRHQSKSPVVINDANLPEIQVVMAMYNEEAVIEKSLSSIINSDYPKDKISIVIGSDNSTDNSHKIVRDLATRHPDSQIYLEIFEGRNGKINIINHLVRHIKNSDDSVLILCDANVEWSETLARQLSCHFIDPEVGIVAANVIDRDVSSEGIAEEEDAYVNSENIIKHAEGTLWGRMMGAFGACYALRRSAYRPIPANFNVDDFFQTIACYESGYKGLVDLEALCYESVSEQIDEEYRRKRRISKGNFQNLRQFANYLLPWNCGWPTFFAFWSHKGLRWFGPVCIIAMFIASIALMLTSNGWIYPLAALGMSLFFALGLFDKVMEDLDLPLRPKLCKLIRYFLAMNAALLAGGIEFCKGVNNSIWEPTKRVAN